MLHHLKRGLSDEDDDDDFDETCAVTASSEVVAAAQNASGGGGTRKRRRGIIEKRRRDRINTSLNELKRLVPTALEKSGSAKLEKAEILQLTVDHLKVLQARGISSETSFDPHRLAADYHAVGFRECAAEVARYLSAVEGIDVQDPLRLRLMSHLQMFASGRAQQQQQQQHHHQQWAAAAAAAASYPPPPTACVYEQTKCLNSDVSTPAVDPLTGYFPPPPPPLPRSQTPPPASSSASSSSTTTSAAITTHQHYSVAPSMPANGYTHFSFQQQMTQGSTHYTPPVVTAATTAAMQAKPYRPWGAEMAC